MRECGDVLCLYVFAGKGRHTRWNCEWSSDVCSSDLARPCTRQLLNHKEGTAVDMHDLSSPVLFVENGVPGSIYRHLHADSVPEETYLAVSSTYFTPGNTVEMIKRAMEEIIATVPA